MPLETTVKQEIIAGRVHSSFLSQGAAIGLAKEGKLRALAVLLERRTPLLPETPTIGAARSSWKFFAFGSLTSLGTLCSPEAEKVERRKMTTTIRKSIMLVRFRL